MFTAEYDILVRNRQAELLREAERERCVAAIKQLKTEQKSGSPARRWAVWLGSALVKWGRKLEAVHKEPSLIYGHHES